MKDGGSGDDALDMAPQRAVAVTATGEQAVLDTAPSALAAAGSGRVGVSAVLSAPDQNAQHSARTRSGRLIFDLNQGEQWRACTEEASVDGRRQLDVVCLSRHGDHVVQTTSTEWEVYPCWDVDGVPRLPILPASKRNQDAGCEGHRILANLHVHPKTNGPTSCGNLSQALQFQPGGEGPAGRKAGAGATGAATQAIESCAGDTP